MTLLLSLETPLVFHIVQTSIRGASADGVPTLGDHSQHCLKGNRFDSFLSLPPLSSLFVCVYNALINPQKYIFLYDLFEGLFAFLNNFLWA